MPIGELFSTCLPFVWRNLRQLGVHEPDLEDQSQEVFLTAHRRYDEWDGQHPRAWLYAIVRRCASAYRRRSHRRHESPVETVPERSDLRDPSARAEIELLLRVLDGLDEEKQAVLLLYEVEGMSVPEIAAAVQCPLPTAYTRLYAARRELTRALEGVKK
ncbi:MAG: hypothetical protein BGO98_35440 [Myxococcales bacterium 68-20]|mgnify:FL=1|nr:MAG: hypothetical protein BGO98_35440 [Myxococcales bacterium 68-20]